MSLEARGSTRGGKRRLLVWLLPLLLLLGVAGAWIALRSGLVRQVYVYPDRTVVREPGASSRVRSVVWSPPREVPSTPAAEWTRGDGAEPAPRPGNIHSTGAVLFAQDTPDRGSEILARELTPAGWSAPLSLEEAPQDDNDAIDEAVSRVNTRFDETGPCLSPDGSTLYFASNRPGGLGGFDLYATRRQGQGWGRPRNLGARVNSPYDDLSPTIHPSGSVLAFSTNRPATFLLAPPADWSDVLLDSWEAGPHALAVCAVPAGIRDSWAEARPLTDIGADGDDRDPCFSPSGDFLYFSSDRSGGHGGFDLYRASLLAAPSPGEARLKLSSPVNLGEPPNSRFNETVPRLFLEGFALAYDAADPQHDSRVTLETRTREVEAGLELASIPLRAIVHNLSRLVVVALVGLGLVLSVILLFRYRQAWQLNLAARCGVLALLFHGVLFYAFYFWVVSDQILALATREAPVSEVSVEKLLQARISMAARRIDVTVPEPTSRESEVSLVARRVALPQPPSAREPTALQSEVAVIPRLPDPDSVIETPEAAVDEPPPPLVDTSPVSPPRSDPASSRLPQPAPVESPESPEPDITSQASVSLKVALEVPRPGPLGAVEEVATGADTVPEVAMVELAATQVQSPAPRWDVLPPQARPATEPEPVIAPLPVAQQAPEAAPSESLPGREIAPRELTSRELPPLETAPPEALDVRTTEIPSDVERWRSVPMGTPPLPEAASDARALREVVLRPRSRPRPLPGSSPRLPEAAPRAEVAHEGAESLTRLELEPRPAARHREPATGRGDRPLSAAPSPELMVQAGPRTAPADSVESVTASAPARLQTRSRPGAAVALPSARLPVMPLQPATKKLPEAGEGGRRESEGAEEVADLLRPPGPSASKVDFPLRAEARPPGEPMTEAELAAASPPPGLPAAVESAVLRAEASARTAPAALPPPRGAEPASSPLAFAGKMAPRLPEAPPDLKLRPDIGTVRSAPVRRTLLRETGGNDRTEAAVSLALGWLARHQTRDGRWDVDHFDDRCGGCRSPGFLVHCDAALTGLALLCFLGQNHSPGNSDSPYRRNTQAAVDWLLDGQDETGCFARDDLRYTMYTHGIVTLALSEAYTLTQDRRLRAPLTRAADLIVKSQNPVTGGWRYKPRPPLRGDTSITGWQVLALTSIRGAGIEVPEATFDRARHWLDEEVSSGTYGGVYGYSKPDEPRVAMVAEGMYARLLLGAHRTDRNIEEAARYLHTETRGGTHLDNFYLLYYGNLALYNYQGWIWQNWNREVQGFLVRTQHRTGPLAGSWDPNGPWSETGGRVLSTCLGALTLEVYYRYLPLYWTGPLPSSTEGSPGSG